MTVRTGNGLVGLFSATIFGIEIPFLRFDGESDADFRLRAERAGKIGRFLIAACLRNRCMQGYLEDPTSMVTVESILRNPTVRIEYEQARAIGGVGECLAATKGKNWGKGPWVLPLEPEDWFFSDRITYVFKENSLYNRRFEQRRRMKRLLVKEYRSLVQEAKSSTKGNFVKRLTRDHITAIRRVFRVGPGEFWRAAKGKAFLDLPPEFVQLELEFGE